MDHSDGENYERELAQGWIFLKRSGEEQLVRRGKSDSYIRYLNKQKCNELKQAAELKALPEIPMFANLQSGCTLVFAFDNLSNHHVRGSWWIGAFQLNLSDGGAKFSLNRRVWCLWMMKVHEYSNNKCRLLLTVSSYRKEFVLYCRREDCSLRTCASIVGSARVRRRQLLSA